MKYDLIYTDDLPEGTGGRCQYPWFPLYGTCVITIKNKYRQDLGILNHELVHCKQYNSNILHALLTKFCKAYRYQIELDAYTEQIKAYNYTNILEASWIINALCNKYNLDVPRDKVMADVEELIEKTKKG